MVQNIQMQHFLTMLCLLARLGVKAGKILIAGDSSGANMAFGVALKAKNAGEDLTACLYLLCPYSAPVVKEECYPSMLEFDGYYCSEGFLVAVCKCLLVTGGAHDSTYLTVISSTLPIQATRFARNPTKKLGSRIPCCGRFAPPRKKWPACRQPVSWWESVT